MGTYKALRGGNNSNNGMKGQNASGNNQKDEQTQRDNANNEAFLYDAAKVAKHTPIGGYVRLAEAANEFTGGRLYKAAGAAMTAVNRNSPFGNVAQGITNNAVESGVSNKVGKVADMKGGKVSKDGSGPSNNMKGLDAAKDSKNGKDKIANGKSNILSSNKKDNDNNSANKSEKLSLFGNKKDFGSFDPLKKMKRKYKIILLLSCGFGFLFFLLIFGMFAADDSMNLDLTNGTTTANFISGTRDCTQAEIESRLIYVGDSRFSGIDSVVGNENLKAYVNGTDYNWFTSYAIPQVENNLSNNENGVVVISMGLKDSNNIDGYITTIKSLMNKYPNNNVFILSLNNIEEDKTGLSNVEIEGFNKKMSNAFGNNYIDIYGTINPEDTIDGITFNTTAMKDVHEYVVQYIILSGQVRCVSGFEGGVDNSKLNGGSNSILNRSLLDTIGQSKLDEWNQTLFNTTQQYYGTGLGPVSAARILIDTALAEGFVFPYFWGGGHGGQVFGISGSWGASSRISASGSNQQPVGSLKPLGMDCSGFVSWALNNGGCRSFTPSTTTGFKNLGAKINPENAKPGDIAVSDSHIVLIIENTGNKLKVAEAKDGNNGIIYSEYDYSRYKSNGYQVRGMSSYYSENCK